MNLSAHSEHKTTIDSMTVGTTGEIQIFPGQAIRMIKSFCLGSQMQKTQKTTRRIFARQT